MIRTPSLRSTRAIWSCSESRPSRPETKGTGRTRERSRTRPRSGRKKAPRAIAGSVSREAGALSSALPSDPRCRNCGNGSQRLRSFRDPRSFRAVDSLDLAGHAKRERVSSFARIAFQKSAPAFAAALDSRESHSLPLSPLSRSSNRSPKSSRALSLSTIVRIRARADSKPERNPKRNPARYANPSSDAQSTEKSAAVAII